MKNLKFYIIIPAYNEEQFINKTLQSLLNQTLLPKRIVVVNDNSEDATFEVVNAFEENYEIVTQMVIQTTSEHQPGSKVIRAFQQGLSQLDSNYDVLCKFDADLIFPEDYLEKLESIYKNEPSTGMVGGFCYIQKEEDWVKENLTNDDHIRGAIKSYRKQCYEQIGGLAPAMGWDTLDEIKASYYGWKIKTVPDLKVKHLKPTGISYQKKSNQKQGVAFYQMRYGFVLTLIASLKLAFRKKQPRLTLAYMVGYFSAVSQNLPYFLTASQGKYLRNKRWKGITKKLF